MEPNIRITTDGACKGNPGPGGWACVLEAIGTSHTKELWGRIHDTTNNVMELTAILHGLEAINRKGVVIEVVTDSKLAVGWIFGYNMKTKQPDPNKKFKINDPQIMLFFEAIHEVIARKKLILLMKHIPRNSTLQHIRADSLASAQAEAAKQELAGIQA